MTMPTDPARGFWVVAGALLLWNLIGDAAYLMQVSMDLDRLAETDAYTARLFAETPPWAWAAYAIGVWSGTAGAIALLLRRKVAVWLFGLSLAGIIAQFARVFLMTDLLAVKGWTAALFPLVIFAIGVFALLYAQQAAQRGWLR